MLCNLTLLHEVEPCDGETPSVGEDVRDFLEVRARGLMERRWHTIVIKRWQYAEDIHVLKARSLVETIRRAACCGPGDKSMSGPKLSLVGARVLLVAVWWITV